MVCPPPDSCLSGAENFHRESPFPPGMPAYSSFHDRFEEVSRFGWVRGGLALPVKRRRAMLASNPIHEDRKRTGSSESLVGLVGSTPGLAAHCMLSFCFCCPTYDRQTQEGSGA